MLHLDLCYASVSKLLCPKVTASLYTISVYKRFHRNALFSDIWEAYSFFFLMFIYLYLAVLGLCFFMGYPLVAMSGGYSPVAVHELLIVVASLVVEHRL